MDKKAGTITSAAAAAAAALGAPAKCSPLAIDMQGLRTDRLLQVSLEEKKEKKKNADATTSAPNTNTSASSNSSNSTRLVVSLTKGRFSEDKKRFVERKETIPWSASCAPPPFASSADAKVVAQGQVLDTQTGQSCTCFLVKTHTSLFLCRIVEEEEEGEEQQQVQQHGQGAGAANARPGRPQQRVTSEEVKVDKESSESSSFMSTDSFALADGPCVVAWERRQRLDEEKEEEGRPKIYCWYQGRTSVYFLEDVPEKVDDEEEEEEEEEAAKGTNDERLVTVQPQQQNLGDGRLFFRVEAPSSPSSYAWSSLDMPPQFKTFIDFPYRSLLYHMHTVHCLCQSTTVAAGGRSFFYSATSEHLELWSTVNRKKKCDFHAGKPLIPVWAEDITPSKTNLEVVETLPLQMCAFLPPPLPSSEAQPTERPMEYVAVLTHSHGLRVFAIFSPPTPSKEETDKIQSYIEMINWRFEPVWEMQGVSEIFCGDFLGTGWDQLALLPLPSSPPPPPPPSSSSSPSSSFLALASSTSASTIALTDLVHVWAHKTCWKREEAPKDLRDKAAYRKGRDGGGGGGGGGEKSKKKEKEKQPRKSKEEEASKINSSKRRPLVVEEAEKEETKSKEKTTDPHTDHHHQHQQQQQQQQQHPPIDQEKRARVVAQIRDALRARLRGEEAEGARLREEGERKQVLLRESQNVLAAMAYQEVLPPPPPSSSSLAACMSITDGATAVAAAGSPLLRSFASSLVPLDDAQGHLEEEEEEEEDASAAIATTPTHTHTPHFPISSHRILQQEIDTDAQRVALDVLLHVRDPTHLRLEHLSLSFFSSTAPVKFTSSIIPSTTSNNSSSNSNNSGNTKTCEVRLQATFNLSPAFLDSTWTSKVTLCCAWRRLVWQGAEEGEEGNEGEGEEMVYPPGAQPLQVLSFSAKNFWGMGASATAAVSSVPSSLPLLWKLDMTLLPGEEKKKRGSNSSSNSTPSGSSSSTDLSWSSRIAAVSLQQNACRLAAVDLSTLCTTLHNVLQLNNRETTKMVPSAMLSTSSPFLQGLATTVGLLQQELDLLCTLVEGKQPEASHIRDVWLSQPALDMIVYLLDQLG